MSRQMKSLVLTSLKGGCGKTHCAAELAKSLRRHSYKVAIIDADYHAPNIVFEFEGLDDPELLQRGSGDKLIPPVSQEGIPVFSMWYFWNPASAVEVSDKEAITDVKQAMESGVIDWGFEPDFLVVDTPPDSTGVISIAYQAPSPLTLIVCQPSRVSRADCERTICLLREKEVPILGIICNQSHLENSKISLFDLQVSDIQALADKYSLPRVWEVPHSPHLGPYFDAIAESIQSISPVVLKVPKPDEEALQRLAKLPKLLQALRGGD